MDTIQKAAVDAVVGLIGTIAEQTDLLVVALFLALGGWVKSKWSRAPLEKAALEAAVAAERWAADEVAAGRDRPAGAAKKEYAIKAARAALPVLHKIAMPGAVGRHVEKAVPSAKRLSTPPPEPSAAN